jgi:thiamine-phosphate pyrophosphorylase
MKTISIKGLYAITPDTADGEALLRQVEAVLKGGARVVQYRNKIEDAPHLEMAMGIAALCRRFNAVFIVNDDVELALQTNADGVHLGRDDGDIAPARSSLGADRIIGVSCYGSLARALEAQAAGADYVAFGSMFPSSTKPQAPHAPLTLLTEAQQALQVPIVAIGGITLHNAPQVVNAGADAVAVISAVFDTPDIAQAAQAFSNLF